MSASPASKRIHSGSEATNVATLTTRPLQRRAGSFRRGTSSMISSAPRAGRKVTTVSRPTGISIGALSSGQEVDDEDHGAREHGQRVVHHVARLQAPQLRRPPRDDAADAVDDAIDDAEVEHAREED